MKDERNSAVVPILATVAVFVVMLTAYIGAYLSLGQYIDWRNNPGDGPTGMIERNYRKEWQPHFFRPAASVESLMRRCDVVLSYSYVPEPCQDP